MARPSSSRPGVNRRAQYGLFVSYVIAIAAGLAGLLAVILSKADPAGFSVIRSALAEVTRPVATTLRSMVSGIGSVDENVFAYVKAGSQNAALRREVESNRLKLIQAKAVAQENIRLKRLLNLTEGTNSEVATAHLISSSAGISRRIARISAGTLQGVQVGMPVRATEGLIGRVLIAGPNSADVLLITDSQNIIPVRRAKDNLAAISSGQDDGTLEIRPLSAGANPFKPGDVMVTTGTGGLYSPNIPVAVIVSIRRGAAIGVPLASPARVENVMIERTYEANIPDPRAGNPAGDMGEAPITERHR